MKKLIIALVMSLFVLPAFAQNNDNNNGKEGMRHERNEIHGDHGQRGEHGKNGHNGGHKWNGGKHHRGPRVHFATPEQVDVIYNYVKDQMSSNDKKKAIKVCMQLTPMRAEDIAKMTEMLSFDDDKMEILEFCYPLCPNKEKYVVAIEQLTFNGNKDKMYKMMATH